jgi:hypothetical protein
MAHGAGQIGGEGQPPGLLVLVHQLLQPRLVEGHLVALERSHALGGDLHSLDVVSEVGQRGGGHQPSAAHPDDSQVQDSLLSSSDCPQMIDFTRASAHTRRPSPFDTPTSRRLN